MTRDEQPVPPARLAPGVITRGGAERTTFAAGPEFTARLRELAGRNGGKLLPGRTEADAALFAALAAPADRVLVTDLDPQYTAQWVTLSLDTAPGGLGERPDPA